jgi:hypothetical protein
MAAKHQTSTSGRIERALEDIEAIQAFISDTNFYRRRYERKKTNFKTGLKILSQSSKEFDRGSAICSNLTPDGMLLSKIKLNAGCIPVSDFTVEVTVLDGALKGMTADANLVYFSNAKGKTQMGLAFEKISKASQEKITHFLSASG